MDDQTIWQCGYYATGVSKDGGQTWQVTASEDVVGMACLLSFADAETGWVNSEKQFKATADGGTTWEELALPESVNRVAAISLRTPTDGYLLDDNGFLYTTQDGGETWSSQRIEFAKGTLILGAENLQAAVRFTDANHGLVVVHLTGGLSSRVVALRTADGGKTWVQEEVMDVPLLIALYLSHDGSVLTVTDHEKRVIVLRYTE